MNTMSIFESIYLKIQALRDEYQSSKRIPGSNYEHLHSAISWLKYAHDVTGNGGVAQTYLVRHQHWAPSYPETTGYIIPTLYRYAALTGDDDSRIRARRMADWEIAIQHPTGGVLAGALGDSEQPTIFNTGQVIFGWVRAFEEEGDEKYRIAAVRAADWLIKIMDDDGCWRQFGSPMTGKQINTYNTRTAWSLARVFDITRETRYLQAAIKNADWAMTQRNSMGWLAQNCLQDNQQPFTHTIAYAQRGLLEIGAAASREDFIEAARVIGDAMYTALPSNGNLPGRFNNQWKPTVGWSCLTGDCQLGINWGRLYKITGDNRYREATTRILTFVKRTQKLNSRNADTLGGIKGSHPIDGGYHPWQYPNWATKFYADALMMDLTNSDGSRYGLTGDLSRND